MDKTLIISRIKIEKKFNSDKELSDFLGITPQSLSTWKSRNSIDYDLVFAKCEEYSPTWLLTGKGQKFLDKTDTVETKIGKPVIPFETFAGFGSGPVSIQQHDIEKYYHIPELNDCDFFIPVKGNSMQPKYCAGDKVACKQVKELSEIQLGRAFVIYHKDQGAMLKRLKASDDPSRLKCVSDNDEFEPFEIKINDIGSIAMVIGAVTIE